MRQNVKRFIIAYNEINRWYDRVQNFQHRYSFVNSGFLFCCMAKWMNLLISTNAHHAEILGQRSIFMRDQIWDSCYHEQKTSGVMNSKDKDHNQMSQLIYCLLLIYTNAYRFIPKEKL